MPAIAEPPERPDRDRILFAIAARMRGKIDQFETVLDSTIGGVRQQIDVMTESAGDDPDIAEMVRGLTGILAGAVAFREAIAEYGPCFTRRLDSPAE